MRSTLNDMKIQIEFMNRGIVPLGGDGAPLWGDINRILANLPPAEARAMKRKFRKEWRKVVKRHVRHGGKKGRSAVDRLGMGNPQPIRKQKNSRKASVLNGITRAVVGLPQWYCP